MTGKIAFGRIPDVVGLTIQRHSLDPRPSMGDLLKADQWARMEACSIIGT
jgi:1-deoxy-D-xylulose 5-phosphate reductoisomerase